MGPQGPAKTRQQRLVQHAGTKRVKLIRIEDRAAGKHTVLGGELTIHPCIVLIRIDALLSDCKHVEGACQSWRRQRQFVEESLRRCTDLKIRVIVEIRCLDKYCLGERILERRK